MYINTLRSVCRLLLQRIRNTTHLAARRGNLTMLLCVQLLTLTNHFRSFWFIFFLQHYNTYALSTFRQILYIFVCTRIDDSFFIYIRIHDIYFVYIRMDIFSTLGYMIDISSYICIYVTYICCLNQDKWQLFLHFSLLVDIYRLLWQ